MNPVVHFEIPADNVDRAKRFYEKIFGWSITRMEGQAAGGHDYWVVRTTEVDEKSMPKYPGAINGGMMKRQMPGQPFTNYITVDSIDKTTKHIKANGGKVCMEKTSIGKMGWIAAFIDTEGNMLGIVEPTKEMKEYTKNARH